MTVKPNSFIIGAPKCGTTSLAAWLSAHPQTFMSPVKEPQFFNTDHSEPFRPTAEEHDVLFSAVTQDQKAIGEASVWYLASEAAVPAILEYQPEAKFIVCLRNPVEMALSLHAQRVFAGTETLRIFEEAWRAQPERRRGFNLPRFREPSRSLYGEVCSIDRQLERLYRSAGRERVHLMFLDDLKANPAAAYASVLRFLEIADDHAPEFKAHNPSQERKQLWLRKLLLRAGLIKRALGIRSGLGLIAAVDGWNRREKEWTVAPETIAELTDYFSDDIERLAAIAGRDLSSWLSDEAAQPCRS